MRAEYQTWLEMQGYPIKTVQGRISNAARVEKIYGDLDAAFDQDGLDALIGLFEYSMDDERAQKPNPTKIPVDGNIRTNLSTYRNSLRLYQQFRQEATNGGIIIPETPVIETAPRSPHRSSKSDTSQAIRDSYERFFQLGLITKEQFFQFGLDETVFAPISIATQTWNDLKNKIENDQEVFVRGHGKDGGGTKFFLEFYDVILGKKAVARDATGNNRPRQAIEKLTGYTIGKKIWNYQSSHIFGRTNNIYAFTAPWNIAFVPKMLDPFTGHEARGEMVAEFRRLFQQQAYEQFKPMIDEFNSIVKAPHIQEGIRSYIARVENREFPIERKVIKRLERALMEQFEPIRV